MGAPAILARSLKLPPTNPNQPFHIIYVRRDVHIYFFLSFFFQNSNTDDRWNKIAMRKLPNEFKQRKKRVKFFACPGNWRNKTCARALPCSLHKYTHTHTSFSPPPHPIGSISCKNNYSLSRIRSIFGVTF